MRRLILSIAVSCLLSACAAGVTPTPDPVPVQPNAALLVKPQPLPQPASGAMPDLEANHRAVAKAYHLLAARYCGLLAWLEIPMAPEDGCAPYRDP